MPSRRLPSRDLLRRAASTDLTTTRRDLLADGFTDAMIRNRARDGQWRALGRGIYRLAPDPLAWQHYVVAAGLAYGQGAAVGGRAAAYVWRLVDSPPRTVTVRVPGTHVRDGTGLWVPRTDRLGRCEQAGPVSDKVRLPWRVRMTSMEDTVLDLLSEIEDEDEVVALLTGALGLFGWAATGLDYWSRQRARLPHRALLRDILDEANGARSVLEYRYRRDCERVHGLPVGELQAAIRSGALHDVAYREYRTLVELDGARYHSGQARFRDMKRDNKSSVLGFTTLRYGWSDVAIRPCEVAAEVAQVLKANGWQGSPLRCRRCAGARG
ncbi:Protein of unknown function [Raineyella antarctica]|uniref:DUF559 domain-containing protein n=1 Tax=Raineyella antarctica TaxID=1577474 RepID=A0A1G6GCR4_9ACTN|nr:DUF559 domain-containing protein [Raineyella antarctica]SDB79792.1 Protein of unknown function [Raineyella antarctica]